MVQPKTQRTDCSRAPRGLIKLGHVGKFLIRQKFTWLRPRSENNSCSSFTFHFAQQFHMAIYIHRAHNRSVHDGPNSRDDISKLWSEQTFSQQSTRARDTPTRRLPTYCSVGVEFSTLALSETRINTRNKDKEPFANYIACVTLRLSMWQKTHVLHLICVNHEKIVLYANFLIVVFISVNYKPLCFHLFEQLFCSIFIKFSSIRNSCIKQCRSITHVAINTHSKICDLHILSSNECACHSLKRFE